MDALFTVLGRIRLDPANPTSRTFSMLIKALDAGDQFDLNALYALGYRDFQLAVELMKQWRLDSFRYERGWASNAASGGNGPLELPAWMHPGRAHSVTA
jgi:hypothetical protein